MTDNQPGIDLTSVPAEDGQGSRQSDTPSPPTPPSPSVECSATTPLHAALLYSVSNQCTSIRSITDDLAVKNNPRPMKDLMGDKAEYWVTKDGNPWRFKFIAKLDLTGHYTKLGPYFNIRDGGIDLQGLQRAKAQLELRPLDEEDLAYPLEAIENSAVAVETLLALCSEVEESRNKKLTSDKRPSVIPFMKPHLSENRYTFVVYTEPLFQGLPKQRSTQTLLPRLTRANIGQSKTLLSPSKARVLGSNTTLKADRSRWTDRTAWKKWGFDDIPDPESRFESMKESAQMDGVVVQGPDVFESNGVFIHPAEYDRKLLDQQCVEVEVLLKLGSYPPNTKEPNGSHVYQLLLKGMKVMPYAEYILNSLDDRETDNQTVGNGKRKAVEDAGGQRPSKRNVLDDMDIDAD